MAVLAPAHARARAHDPPFSGAHVSSARRAWLKQLIRGFTPARFISRRISSASSHFELLASAPSTHLYLVGPEIINPLDSEKRWLHVLRFEFNLTRKTCKHTVFRGLERQNGNLTQVSETRT